MGTSWPPGEPRVVTLPSGRRLRGGRVRDLDDEADWSLVLTTLPRRPGRGEWIWWPDFGLPLRPAAARRAIARAWERSADESVQIACGGGVGRTGTALAACAVLDGMAPDAAIAHIRREYHPRAVETPWQRRWLDSVFLDRSRDGLESVSARKARRILLSLMGRVNGNQGAVEIVSRRGRAVLMSAAEYSAWQEAAHLFRSPVNARRLLDSYDRARSGEVEVRDLDLSDEDD